MKPIVSFDVRWVSALWIATLAAVSGGLTATYTCVVPFAALSVAAAMTLSARQALLCTAVVWLANQAAGFGLVSYPWTLDAFGWAVAIGAAAIAGTLATQWLLPRLAGLRSIAQTVIAFGLAFAVYETALYAAAVSALGGTAAFAPAIIAQVLGVNVVALVALWSLNQLLRVAFSSYLRRVSAPPARFA
jgi:hypothetical protein